MGESRRISLPWNEETVHALGLYRFIGRSLGIWPLKSNDFESRIRLSVIAVLQIILTCSLIQELLSSCVVISDAVGFVGMLGSNTVCMLKISVIRLKEEKMHRILSSAVNDWSIIRDEESRKIMRKHAYRGKIISTLMLSMAYVAIGSIMVLEPPALGAKTESRNLPFGTGCIVANTPYFLYLGIYVLQLFQLLCMGTCNFGTDSLFVGIAMHLCAQFELLQNDISRLDRQECEKNPKQKFVTLIRRHNHLVRLVNFVEDVFHLIILGQLAASGLHVTIGGIQMLFAIRDHYYAILLYTPTGIILLLLQLCMYSFVGDRLSSHVEEVRNATYNCSWYKFSPGFARDVLFVIVRSNDQFHLTAGKVFRMNLEGFTRIIKTMASFFSFIKITIIG